MTADRDRGRAATLPSPDPSLQTPDVPDPIIELRGVHKSFGRQRVLVGIDLKIERGKNTVVIGRSGCGKSVMLKHIVGLLRPDAGEVYFEGHRIDTLREHELVPIRRQISFVFQLNALFDSMTVAENVAFAMTECGTGRADKQKIAELVRRSLGVVGLEGFENKRPAELSGGEKKRVALARAIALDPAPKVILYDEPTAGLDPQRADTINKLIRHLQEEFHVTGVVVTHDMKSAAHVGDRVLMLHDGRFIADGPPEVLQNSPDPRVRKFVEGVGELEVDI